MLIWSWGQLSLAGKGETPGHLYIVSLEFTDSQGFPNEGEIIPQ